MSWASSSAPAGSGWRGRQVPLDQLRQIEQKFALLAGIRCPALRLDCIVAVGFSLSRGESQRAVSAGRVLVNQRPVEKPTPGSAPAIRSPSAAGAASGWKAPAGKAARDGCL